MTADFYHQAAILDALVETDAPTREQFETCVTILKQPSLLRYFFHGLDNPAWLPPLAQAGVFDVAPAPKEAEPGFYRLPVWEASRYLARVADKHPQIVARIALTLHTENARVHNDLVEAALRMPGRYAAVIEPAVATWLDGPFRTFLPEKVADLMVHLAKENEVEAAIHLLQALTSPAKQTAGLSAGSEEAAPEEHAKPALDEYQLAEILQEQVQELVEKNCDRVVTVLENHLVTAIYRESGQRQLGDPTRFSLWAEETESDDFALPVHGYKSLLFRGLRATLERAPDEVLYSAARRYMDHPYVVLRRLGIRLIGSHLEQCGKLAEELLGDRETVIDNPTWPEMYRLMEAGFGRLSAEARLQLLDWIITGPTDSELENEKEWYRQRHQEKPSAEHMQAWRDYWVLEHLWPLRNHDLPDEVHVYLEQLASNRDEPPTPPSRGVVSVSFSSLSSIKSKDELIEMGPAETVAFLLKYAPQPADFPLDASREGLARTLQEVVREQPEQYAQFAPRFAEPGMAPVYVYHLLRGLEEAWTSGENFDWVPVFELITKVVRREDLTAQDEDDDEPGWASVDGQIASLIEESVRRDEHALPDEHMETARDILLRLVDHADPSEATEIRWTSDPATLAINSVRGKALGALIMYALRRARILDKEAPSASHEAISVRLEPVIREALTHRLDRDQEISRGVHSLFGKFLPQLRYLDEGWFDENLARILPEGQDQAGYWRAAWSSYVAFNSVYSDLYQRLRKHYRRAIEAMVEDGDPKAGLESVRDRLAGHVLAAYWGGAETLDEDSLVSLLFRIAPPEVRGNAVRMIQRWLINGSEITRQEVWPRLQTLWETRVGAAEDTADRTAFRAELSAYVGWLTGTPAGLDMLYSLIERTLPYLQEGTYGDLLLEYIHRQALIHPVLAVHVLLQMLTQGAEPFLYKQNLVADILTSAMKSGNSDARADATQVINLFGERGEYAYRGFLEIER